MERYNNPYRKSRVQIQNILRLLLVVPFVLETIGDIVIFLAQSVICVPVTTYNIITTVLRETLHAVVHWFSEKIHGLNIRGRPSRPEKRGGLLTRLQTMLRILQTTATSLHLRMAGNVAQLGQNIGRITASFERGFVRLAAVVIGKLRLLVRIPKISIPTGISRRLRFRRFLFPKITLPAFLRLPKPTPLSQARKVTFPRAYTVYPPPEIVIRKRVIQVKAFATGVAATILFLVVPLWTYGWLSSLPHPQLLSRRDLSVTTKILDRNGALLYEIYADQNRTPIPLSEIPLSLKQATIAIEDRDFYQHGGISLRGIVRALREIVINKRIQGGSTITQQLIKSALLSPEISLSRKLKEIFLAFWAERLYTKDQILEMYLNQVPYGGTAWGIEAASQTYFGKSVKELTLAEAALLAGLPAAPSEYSPFGSHPQKAFERQAEVLRRMTEDGDISRDEAQAAYAQGLRFATPTVPIRAPHFVMYVRELLERRLGSRLVERGGLRIVTSLDIGIQEKVEDIVQSQIESLASLQVGNGAALVTNPKTGEILAMVGSKNYFNMADEGNVNVTTSLRQPGSSIKVVNYTAALENGFTAASILDDSPVVYPMPGAAPYAPVNYDGKFHGLVPLRYALGNSYNVPAVKVLSRIGIKTMIDKGRLMGIESWSDESRYGLSLTLGGGDVTMLGMAKVYGTLADEGKRQDLLPILDVADYTGRVIEHNSPAKSVQATTPEVAWIVSNILSDNVARMSAFGPNSSLVIPGHTVSVKTGTSNEKRDNWTIGYTPSYVVVVWVGNNNNAPMNPILTSGVTGAAPIWHDIMTDLTKGKPDEVNSKPVNVVALPCYMERLEFFIRGTEPSGGRCGPLPSPSPSPTH